MAQLNDDLLSIKQETLVNLTSQLPQFYEGPWLHKYNGVYYLSYPTIDKEYVGVLLSLVLFWDCICVW